MLMKRTGFAWSNGKTRLLKLTERGVDIEIEASLGGVYPTPTEAREIAAALYVLAARVEKRQASLAKPNPTGDQTP